jgi:rhamnosyl/mannosyltransferase
MRIVEVGKYYPPVPGGIENNVRQCCHALAPSHDVHALVCGTSSSTVEERREGIPVVRVASLGKVAAQPIAPAMAYHLRRLAPDLVHLHAPNPLGLYSYLLATPHTPLVITHHCDIVQQRYLKHLVLPFYRYALHRAEAVLLYTAYYGRTSAELKHVQDKITVIPHGTEAASFRKTEYVAEQARRLREEKMGEAPVVAFLGRHVPYKGVHVLLRALARLPGVHALIGGDGHALEENKQLARALGVDDRAHFLGRVKREERASFFYAADVLALPSTSRSESFGQVQVEAQLCRRPVVTTDMGGAPEVTIDGKTGRVVPPEDPSALSEALRGLLGDAALRERLGEAGYHRAKARYVEVVTKPELQAFFRRLQNRLQKQQAT